MNDSEQSPPALGTYGIEKTVGDEGASLFPILNSHAGGLPDAKELERIQAAFDKLMRGLAHMSGELTYAAYRELYERGPSVIPLLEQRILQADWQSVTRPEATRMQTALVSLLHDIDEARSRTVIGWLLARDCHPSLRGALQSILRYDGRNFRTHSIRGVRVFVANEIDASEDVPRHIDRWLANVPQEDLAGISRLYVVRRPDVADIAGYYMPVLSTITVYWSKALFGNDWLTGFLRLFTEHTLYHEIGHHVHRHTFGQQPEQEKEADRYAARRLRAHHPFLAAVARPLSRFVDCKPYRS